MTRIVTVVFSITLAAGFRPAMAQAPNAPARPARPTPPTRDPHTPGYVTATELPDGMNPSPKADGNFILGPTHNPVPEVTVQDNVRHGTVYNFTMESTDSKFYPGIAREPNTFARPDPNDRTKVLVESTPPPIRAAWPYTCPNNMSQAQQRRSSWAQTGRTRCYSRPLTISSHSTGCR